MSLVNLNGFPVNARFDTSFLESSVSLETASVLTCLNDVNVSTLPFGAANDFCCVLGNVLNICLSHVF